MFCTNCGSKLEEGYAFCTNCGTRVPKAAASDDETIVMPPIDGDMSGAFEPSPVSDTTAQVPAAEQTRRYDAIPPEDIVGASSNGKSTSRKGLIVGIIIAAVAVIALVIVLIFTFALPSADNADAEEVTITFETQGGSTIAAIEVDPGETVSSPADPAKNGYSFGGWYADASFTTPVAFPLTPTEDMTLYAQWTALTDNSGASAGSNSETYSTDDQARAALEGYLDSLEEANDVVHDFATDDFNNSYNQGKSKVRDALDECYEAREEVEDLLMDASGTQWKVSTMSLPDTFSEERAQLEEASDMLLTRLNAYESALSVISNMGSNATDKAIDTAIEDYLADGHEAYETYKSLVKKVKKDL